MLIEQSQHVAALQDTLNIGTKKSSGVPSIMERIDIFVRKKVISSFFSFYKVHSPQIAKERRDELLTVYAGAEIKCKNDQDEEIDAIVLHSQAQNKTENFLVACLNTTYQDRHPKHWNIFLENGADVVLWNPTQLGPKAYAQDLHGVLKALRAQHPTKALAVSAYCMATDPAISAVSDMQDPNIHLIVDRGHGDAPHLVRSMTLLGRLSLIRKIVAEECDCQGLKKIQDIRGKLLFISPGKVDQVMNYAAHKSFSKDLRAQKSDAQEVVIEGGDHWSKWDYNTYTQVLLFLCQLGIVRQNDSFVINPQAYPAPSPLSYFQEKILPIKLKIKATIGQF